MRSRIRNLTRVAPVLVASFLIQATAQAATIAVIGTGQVGSALGPEFAAQGHTIVYGSREPMREDVQALVARTGDAASAAIPAEAVERLERVPRFVRGMVKRIYTEYAQERGITEFTPELMDQARTELGLEGM